MTVGNEVLRRLGLLELEFVDDTSVSWIRLTGGFHNDVHLVRVHDSTSGSRAFVVKHFNAGVGNPLYPQLPADEHRALTALIGTGLAPRPLAFDPDVDGRALLVYEFVEGEMWSSDVTTVARVLARVHGCGITDGFRSLSVGSTQLDRHSLRILGAVPPPPRLRTFLEGSNEAHAAHELTLVHTDCGPGNLVVGDEGVVLIDWQCPGIGDPVEDLANFASAAIQVLYGRPPLTEEETTTFLDAYGDGEVVDRFERLRWNYHARLAAYCVHRRAELAMTQPDVADKYAVALEAELDLLDSRR